MNIIINIILLLLLFMDIIKLDSYIKQFDKARRFAKYRKNYGFKLNINLRALVDFSLSVIVVVFGFIYFTVG